MKQRMLIFLLRFVVGQSPKMEMLSMAGMGVMTSLQSKNQMSHELSMMQMQMENSLNSQILGYMTMKQSADFALRQQEMQMKKKAALISMRSGKAIPSSSSSSSTANNNGKPFAVTPNGYYDGASGVYTMYDDYNTSVKESMSFDIEPIPLVDYNVNNQDDKEAAANFALSGGNTAGPQVGSSPFDDPFSNPYSR